MEQVIADMKNVEPQKQTIWQHGESVAGYCMDLIDHVCHNKPPSHTWYKLPAL